VKLSNWRYEQRRASSAVPVHISLTVSYNW
jgi:hypothetical protein